MSLLVVSCPLFLAMHVLVLLCLRTTSVIPHLVGGSVHAGNETDRLALLSFKNEITSDPFGALNSWNETIHFCQWAGVTCGHRHHQRVIILNLKNRKLTGSISPHMGNLSFLRILSLRNNSLSNKIPQELGRLRRLQYMSLTNNSLTGKIPTNISSCSNLYGLSFTGNKLEGKIPAELGSLSKLKDLRIQNNNLTGCVPSTFGNLSSFQYFDGQSNDIDGNIPDAIGRLKKLQVLALGFNRLVGTIPSSIFNLSSLRIFIVPMNQLLGELPLNLGISLPNIQLLELSTNLFTGTIPLSISNATKLYRLNISYNNFTGKVPSLEKLHDLEVINFYDNYLGTRGADDLSFLCSLTNATKIRGLELSNNNFGGMLPESVSNFSTNLRVLALAQNNIVGSIPTGIGNLFNLFLIDIGDNHFTGKVLVDFGKLKKLLVLRLSSNKFHGVIPSSFENLTSLIALQLRDNNLHGSIPSSLGKCHMLTKLILNQNNLSGSIPKEIFGLPSLLNLYLSDNKLTASLPLEVGKLINLESLQVSENLLSGKIPSTLGSCVKLSVLDMNGNKFWGILPFSLSNLRGLEELDLSRNNFSGKIPDFLEGFIFLQFLNLSFNDFEGEVPKSGIFKNATAISVEGNNKLCGGISELQLHSCNSKGLRRKRFMLTLKFIIPASFGLVGLILTMCFLYLYCFRKTKKLTTFRVLGYSLLKLSYQSLLKATNGFSQANLIGVGSFGSVYKGILDQGEKIVAVKVLNLQFRGASKSFIAECEALRRIKHRNIVKVITACSSVDYHGNDFKAIVFEFMVNGSLEKWLRPNEIEDESTLEESRSLNLLQRVNIGIDVASALDYLHNCCPEPIIHCDLKPSNVLLDNEMTGHVGDFGLARFLQETTSNPSTNQSSSIGIRGTVGYAAPEYGMGNEVSISGDVYSFGILLLEMFTGKRPTDNMFSDSLSLHSFAKTALPEQVMSIADRALFQLSEEGEASSSIQNTRNRSSPTIHMMQECLISVLNVGIACSEDLPRDRPAISEVVPQLQVIKNTLLGTGGMHGYRRARIAVPS